MAVINLASKYEKKLDERFKLASLTDAFAGKQYSFEGVNAIKIWTVDQVEIADYNRSASDNRFGTPKELGDTVQTLVMNRDRGYTFTIDYGNAGEQFNIKHCNAALKQIWDEQITPEIDMYRFKSWANGAGLGKYNATALTKTTVMEAILSAHAAMNNALVPREGRATFVSETLAIQCKLAAELQYNEAYTGKAIVNGQIGKINGSPIISVPDSYLPEGVSFLIKYKNATVDPIKRKVLRVQKHPRGFDGDVGEGRVIYDAFVLDQKINGIFVYASSGYVQPVTFTISNNAVTMTSATSGATIYYTTDGTNPKTSSTRAAYSSAVSITANTRFRAYAEKSGMIKSQVTEYSAAYSA